MTQMDIVLLVFDTLRADHLSGYGYPQTTSPHWDTTAAQATLFTQAVSPAHWTLPGHASLFTGLYPSQHTMVDMNSALPNSIPTLAERLQRAGYATVAISNNPLIGAHRNGLERGFERIENYSFMRFALWNAHLNSPVSPECSLRGWLKHLRGNLAHWMGYDGTSPRQPWKLLNSLLEQGLKLGGEKYRNTQRSLQLAAHLLSKRPRIGERPLFIFINLMGTHTPYEPPAWALRQFLPDYSASSAKDLLRRINLMQLDPVNWLAASLADPDQLTALHRIYDAEVAAQDKCFGEFFTQLKISGAIDHVLLIATSDHGEHLGEKQRLSHIFGAYQPLLHVPLLIYSPQDVHSQGKTVDTFVSTRRLFHTILAKTDLATSDERKFSLLPLDDSIHNLDPEWNSAFSEAVAPATLVPRLETRRPGIVAAHGYTTPIRALFEGDYKLIHREMHPDELYAVRTDPTESHDLAATESERTAQLAGTLRDYLIQYAPFAQPVTVQEEADVMQRLRMLGYVD